MAHDRLTVLFHCAVLALGLSGLSAIWGFHPVLPNATQAAPIILWGVEPSYTHPRGAAPTDSQLKAAMMGGFGWLQTYGGVKIEGRDDSVAAFLQRLSHLGLKLLPSIERIVEGKLDTAFVARKVARWKGQSAIGAWLLVDEPEMKRVDLTSLREAYSVCKELDPSRPVLVVWAPHGSHAGYEALGQIFDWAAMDVYPNRASGFDSLLIQRSVAELIRALPLRGRRLIPILQAFADRTRALPDTVSLKNMIAQFRDAGAGGGLAFYNWNVNQTSGNLGSTVLWGHLLLALPSWLDEHGLR